MRKADYLYVFNGLADLGGDLAAGLLGHDLILLVGDGSDGLNADRSSAQEDLEELQGVAGEDLLSSPCVLGAFL